MSACELDEVDRIVISSPCTVPWESMRGDNRVRHCTRCRQDVFNISELTRHQAKLLIANRQGRLCVKLYRRPDGTVVTADCWSRLRAARRRGLVAWTLALIAVAWAQVAAIRVGLRALREVLPRDRPPPKITTVPFDPDAPLAPSPFIELPAGFPTDALGFIGGGSQGGIGNFDGMMGRFLPLDPTRPDRSSKGSHHFRQGGAKAPLRRTGSPR